MLTPEQIEGFRLAAGRLIDPINTYLLKDIARRIQDAGKLTSTAAYEAWRAEWLGKDRKELERDLAQLLGVTRGEARKLLRTAARYGYDTTLSRYPGHLIPFDANPAIQQIVSAAVTLAGDELKNITQTKAIMLMDPYGQYQTLPKAYMACTDYAFQQVFTGAVDYNTAIRPGLLRDRKAWRFCRVCFRGTHRTGSGGSAQYHGRSRPNDGADQPAEPRCHRL